MKRLVLICFGILIWADANAQDKLFMQVLSSWHNPSLPRVDGDQIWNDCMGWKDTIKDKEYFISGTTDSIYFFDITNPTIMKLCAVKAGRARSAINRDYQTYDHYLYTVSDRTAGIGGLQIFDLNYLPDSVHEVFNSDTFGSSTHTIFIEEKSKRLYMCTNTLKPAGISAMDVLSLTNPEKPEFIGRLNTNGEFSKVHEMYARNDTAYLSCEGYGLFIMDMRDAANATIISSIKPPYVQSGYNHSSWLDSSGRYLLFTDETQGMGIKLVDLADIRHPEIKTVWNSNIGALPHNAYWKGHFAYVSSYEDGVYIYDLRNPQNYVLPGVPPVAAYYDTYPKNPPGTYSGFHGCWGVWPFLPSGNILVSDMSEGLFVMRPMYNLTLNEEKQKKTVSLNIYPNPFSTMFTIKTDAFVHEKISASLYNITGALVEEKIIYLQPSSNEIDFEQATGLEKGIYILRITTGNSSVTHKIIKN